MKMKKKTYFAVILFSSFEATEKIIENRLPMTIIDMLIKKHSNSPDRSRIPLNKAAKMRVKKTKYQLVFERTPSSFLAIKIV